MRLKKEIRFLGEIGFLLPAVAGGIGRLFTDAVPEAGAANLFLRQRGS